MLPSSLPSSGRVRISQIGTKHGHAPGKWKALVDCAEVEAVGLWEPDANARDGARFAPVRWLGSIQEALASDIAAVAIEGRNDESLAMARSAVDAGKHLWFDKPAGEDWPVFQQLMADAAAGGLYIQMGYMFRYQPGFQMVSDLARAGALGDVFQIRAHMSTHIDVAARRVQSVHKGGILYDLAGHMLDQICWLTGRPTRVTSFTRNDATPDVPAYSDNTLAVLEFDRAIATIDVAAMESRPLARRFEVYGTLGSAITEPFDHGRTVRIALERPWGDLAAGEHIVDLPVVTRQQMYERELAAFVRVLCGQQPPDRPPEHELLVQETLLRATGRV